MRIDHEDEIRAEIIRPYYEAELEKLTALKESGKLTNFYIDIYIKDYEIDKNGVLVYGIVINESFVPVLCPDYIDIKA